MSGGTKLLLTGSVLPGARTEAHTRPLYIKFDQTEVPPPVLLAKWPALHLPWLATCRDLIIRENIARSEDGCNLQYCSYDWPLSVSQTVYMTHLWYMVSPLFPRPTAHTCLCTVRIAKAPLVPQVPALVLQSGVLRCHVPPHPPGIVRICLTNGDGRPRSRLHSFEYRDAPDANTGAPNRWDLKARYPA